MRGCGASSPRKFLLKPRWIVLLLATLSLLFSWRPLLVFAATCSDDVRHFVLSIDGATGIKSDIAMRNVSADFVYPILGECYLSLRRDYENGAGPPDQPNAAHAFERAFGGFRCCEWRTIDQEAEKARFKDLFTKTFGRTPGPRYE